MATFISYLRVLQRSTWSDAWWVQPYGWSAPRHPAVTLNGRSMGADGLLARPERQVTYHAPFILADDLPAALILGAAFLAANRIDISLHWRILIADRFASLKFTGRRRSPQWVPFRIELSTPGPGALPRPFIPLHVALGSAWKLFCLH